MNCLGSGIWIPFSKHVAMSRIVRLFFTAFSNSHFSISIALRCAFAIACTFVDGYTFTSTMFSFLAFVCAICACIDCYSTLSSSDYLMNIRFIDVAPNPICFLSCQLLLLLHKNSTIDGLVLYISWIIVYTNCIFSLYVFPFAHFEDDDEYSGDLIAKD